MKVPYDPSDEETRLLAARAAELIRKSEYELACSDFLTPREQRLFYVAAATAGEAERLFFWGGALGAERRRALFLPDWLLDSPGGEPFSAARDEKLLAIAADGSLDLRETAVPVALHGSGFVPLAHRDWMGAALALGIERAVLGDIVVENDREALTFALPHVAKFLEEDLTHAGADTVRAEATELPPTYEIVRAYERVEGTVASPRLDGVVHALTSLSRADSAALVRSGAVERNYFAEVRPDCVIEDGDVLTLRGFGKYLIDSTNAVTRRGRNRLVARKYK